ncbi:MAG: VTT domain-containing protein [Candidatus Kerfeldbacteria bacterium]
MWALETAAALKLLFVFLVGFILPIVPPFPVRLAVVIPIVSASVNPIAVVLAAALGSSLGTLPLYGLSMKAKDTRLVKRWLRREWVRITLRFLEGKMFLTVLLFALLPLPDQLMSVIGGLQRYPARRMALGFFIGRLPYYCALAYLGSSERDIINGALKSFVALFGM